jgi:hypothetical protein
MATNRLAVFTEGSLLKRTLVSVGTFVLGSVVLLGIMSLVLVSIARAVIPSHGDKDKKADDKSEAAPGSSVIKPGLPKPRRTKSKAAASEPAPTAAPAAEDSE